MASILRRKEEEETEDNERRRQRRLFAFKLYASYRRSRPMKSTLTRPLERAYEVF